MTRQRARNCQRRRLGAPEVAEIRSITIIYVGARGQNFQKSFRWDSLQPHIMFHCMILSHVKWKMYCFADLFYVSFGGLLHLF